MYKCSDCGAVFFKHDACPYCGGISIAAMKCQGCDEYISVEDDYSFCSDCVNNILSRFAIVMQNNFREDEYDVIINHLEDVVPYKREDQYERE